MGLFDAIDAATFYRAPDGRTVFRPWATFGPCYLVPDEQRRRFTRFLKAYYVLMLAGIVGTEVRWGWRGVAVFAPLWLAGVYLSYWLFSRRLPTTPPPPRPSRAEVRERLRQHNSAIGRRTLIIMLALALLMTATAAYFLIAASAGEMLFPVLFFGACAAVFAWQLRNS